MTIGPKPTAWSRALLALMLLVAPAGARSAALQIAVTVDDLPVHDPILPGQTHVGVTSQIIDDLKAAGVPPTYGFVNGVFAHDIPDSAPVLTVWRAAGFPLGNHTFTHMNLDTQPLEAWEKDVLLNEPILRANMGAADWHWLRFPYLAEGAGQKQVDARNFLRAHGYRIAQVTMSFGDYLFDEPYFRCNGKKDQASLARLEDAYMAAAAGEVKRARAMSNTLYGRDIPYVLLVHNTAMEAHMLPRLLDYYKTQGFSFVTLEQAEADSFYKPDVDLTRSGEQDSLDAAMRWRYRPVPGGYDLGWIDRLCR